MTRKDALRMDNAGWFCRELAFYKWARETVFPAAVLRHIEAIGRQTITTQQELDRLLKEHRNG